MLDLEAHRLGMRGHLCVERASALHHARMLGVAPERVHPLALDPADARRGDDLPAVMRTVALPTAGLARGD